MTKISNVPLFGGPFAGHIRDFDSDTKVLLLPIVSSTVIPILDDSSVSVASMCYAVYHLERMGCSTGRLVWVGRYSELQPSDLLYQLNNGEFE